ncbi:MAG TPA: TolC family protein [bacterium]|nr:TolC family protein [bacterium]
MKRRKIILQRKLLHRLNDLMKKVFSDIFRGASLKKTLLCFFILSGYFLLSGSEAKVYTKDQFVEAFIEKADIIESLKYKIESAQADYNKVLSQYFPKIKFTFGVGPHPKYEYERARIEEDGQGGYTFIESDWIKSYYDLSEYGVAIRMKGDIVLPVYTFGKIKNGLDVTKAQIEAKKAEAAIGELKLRKEAAVFYWSWVMASEMFATLEPALQQVDKAEEKLKEMLFEEKEGVRQKDLIKLRIEKEKLAYRHKKLVFQMETLKEVISQILGENWQLADSSMKVVEYKKEYDQIVDYMFSESPYSKYLTSGLSAYENLYELEISKILPDLGIAGYFTYKYTSSVYEKNYPYPDSPYNGWDGELGIGFVFNLNFVEQGMNIKKAKSEWRAMKAQASFAKKSAPLIIKQKYNELKSLESQVEHMKNARKFSKGWMTSEFTNYESGFNNTNDLIDAVKVFFENEYLYIQSIYDYNMKVEDLIEYTGAR